MLEDNDNTVVNVGDCVDADDKKLSLLSHELENQGLVLLQQRKKNVTKNFDERRQREEKMYDPFEKKLSK